MKVAISHQYQHFERKQRVTIVIAVHNEEMNIASLIERISKTVSSLPKFDFELLFVDDGSTDQTIKEIMRYSTVIPIGYIKLSRNFGHQSALEAGLRYATGDVIITMDGDLQHPPELIPGMMAEYDKGADVVQMQRSNSTSDLKGFLSITFYSFFSRISETRVIPNAADFRLMNRRVVDELIKMHGKGLFLRALVPSLGFSQISIPYMQPPRKLGKASYTFSSSYMLALHSIFKFTTFPGNAMVFSGTMLMLLSVVFVLLLTFKVATSAIILYAAIVSVLGGLILLSSGVICWYLYFILEQVRQDPSFIISDMVLPTTRVDETAD